MEENQRVRSPRYPSFALPEAEGMARKIYANDGMNSVDRESAVQHLGYSGLNGASATALASLKQYGLVIESGKGMIRLSDLALDLIEPESEAGKADALRSAAFSPDLFAALRERFPDTVPSESNLRAHLLRQRFTIAAVKSVVPAYLETCEYLASTKVAERGGLQYGSAGKLPTELDHDEQKSPETPTPTRTQGAAPSNIPNGGRRMIFDTEEGEVVFTYPDGLSEVSVDDIEEWFALVAKRLRRASKQ